MYKLRVFSGLFFFLSLLLYYYGQLLPVQIVIPGFKGFLAMISVVNTFVFLLSIVTLPGIDAIKNKLMQALVWLIASVIVLHSLLHAILLIGVADFVDEKIVSVSPADPRRKVIVQHQDEGAFGDSFRTVTVYELTSFFKIIEDLSWGYGIPSSGSRRRMNLIIKSQDATGSCI